MNQTPAYLEADCAWMREALAEACKAALIGEIPVGAVVVKDGLVIARGHNRREADGLATAHAEIIAIEAACRAIGSWRLSDCQLYVTLEPCPMCSGAIINSRLKRLVYGARDEKAGCCGSVIDLFALPFNHSPILRSGILAEDCARLLTDFFVGLRGSSSCREIKP